MKKKTTLACASCGSRNYTTEGKSAATLERLEVNKYCKRCNAHTVHKETK
ncbi:50S ribosomal protein L33 [Lederbergia lenta]|nr:50S ribosomal protein L33 [Lederbergia lenta]MEC2326294.1 50S ribosomal protein L33 [Lederbergia lenta]